MAWLDKLKSLFNIELKAPLVSINITKNANNKINQGKECAYTPEKQQLELYLGNISEEKKSKLAPIMRESITEGQRLLKNQTSSLLHKLQKYNQENPDAGILAFFKPIIPQADFEALEASLYLRTAFNQGEDVLKLKQDIRNRFGDRGNNIANLCTAGYFEEFLMPLYNSSKEQFEKLYDIIAQKSVVAVFVHSQMNLEKIPEEISTKLAISKQYGIKFIHIHGIGESNVNKIKKAINDKKQFFDFFEKSIYEKDNIIIVELLLK